MTRFETTTFAKSALAVVLLATAAGCATRPATPAASTTAPNASSSAGAGSQAGAATGGAQGSARALPPVSSGGTVGERQVASVPNRAPGTEMSASAQRMAASIAELGDRVFFETDSYSLTAEGRAVLERQAAWMQANPGQRFLLAGNADERGTREYNLALGARRASAARDYLVALGVPPSRLETVSYGKERPMDARPNPDGWSQNRNAQTTVLSGS